MLNLTPIAARDPIYNDETGNSIFLYVKFEEFDEELPFTATNFDVTEYGRNLYANAVAGMYGPIGVFVPPPPLPTVDQPTVEGAQTL